MADKGDCSWLIGEPPNQSKCPNPATTFIFIRDRLGKVSAPVCGEHKSYYNQEQAKLRRRNKNKSTPSV